jgi:hypothetical protein
MSRSYRTSKVRHLANRRIARDRGGSIIYPRVIARKPAPGEIHPLPSRAIRKILRHTPIEYIYGLKHIELRPRPSSTEVGSPYGCYFPKDKIIQLFSLPLVWKFNSISDRFQREMENFGAKVTRFDDHVEIDWLTPENARLARWFCAVVLTHELGHHFVEQYQTKRGRIGKIAHEEIVAEIHSFRLWDRLVRL